MANKHAGALQDTVVPFFVVIDGEHVCWFVQVVQTAVVFPLLTLLFTIVVQVQQIVCDWHASYVEVSEVTIATPNCTVDCVEFEKGFGDGPFGGYNETALWTVFLAFDTEAVLVQSHASTGASGYETKDSCERRRQFKDVVSLCDTFLLAPVLVSFDDVAEWEPCVVVGGQKAATDECVDVIGV